MVSSPPGWLFSEVAALLHIFGPFVLGFFANWLFYRWVESTGRQSAGFSAIVAATLTTPPLVAIFFVSAKNLMGGFDAIPLRLYHMIRDLQFFLPMVVVPGALLVGYLLGGFRKKRVHGAALCVVAIAAVLLDLVGLYFLLAHES